MRYLHIQKLHHKTTEDSGFIRAAHHVA